MISLFRVRIFLKRVINSIFSANRYDIRGNIMIRDVFIDGEVSYIINSSVIIHYIKNNVEYYFRECYVHHPLKQYLQIAIEDYCRNISKTSDPDRLLSIIENDLKIKDNYKKYKRVPEVFDRHLLKILTGEFMDYGLVGLPSFRDVADHQEFIGFLKYTGAVMATYMANSYVRYGYLENGNSNKQIATYLLSQILGVRHLIPKVEMAEIKIKGKSRIGTIMEKAQGENVAYIQPDERPEIEKSSFLRDLTNLEYLDALCYQLDHRLDNYNIVCNNSGKATTVVAFDNDASRTFFPLPLMPRQTYAGASCVLKGGYVNRPYIDSEFAKKIECVTKEDLKRVLSPFLTFFQLSALWNRIKLLKEAISKTKESNQSFIVENDKWDAVDEKKELDNKYGKTYYYLYRYDTMLIDRERDYNNRKQCI